MAEYQCATESPYNPLRGEISFFFGETRVTYLHQGNVLMSRAHV